MQGINEKKMAPQLYECPVCEAVKGSKQRLEIITAAKKTAAGLPTEVHTCIIF